MSLKDKIGTDLRAAQKEGNQMKVAVLRFLNAQLQNKEIEKRGRGQEETLSEAEVVEVLQKEGKKRREAIELFRQGNRRDLAEKEEKEAEIIASYLPRQMSREEIGAVVDGLKASGLADFNALIKAAMQELKGKADGKTVSEVVKEKLG